MEKMSMINYSYVKYHTSENQRFAGNFASPPSLILPSAAAERRQIEA